MNFWCLPTRINQSKDHINGKRTHFRSHRGPYHLCMIPWITKRTWVKTTSGLLKSLMEIRKRTDHVYRRARAPLAWGLQTYQSPTIHFTNRHRPSRLDRCIRLFQKHRPTPLNKPGPTIPQIRTCCSAQWTILCYRTRTLRMESLIWPLVLNTCRIQTNSLISQGLLFITKRAKTFWTRFKK